MIGGEGDAHARFLASNFAARHRLRRPNELSIEGRVGRWHGRCRLMSFGLRIGTLLERTIHVIAGLPIAIDGVSVAPTPEARVIRRAFARRY
jgi:hypothetical protein